MEITVQTVVFYFLAFFIALTSILTVTTQRIVRSATYLLFTLFATAGIYFLLGYSFLGSVQMVVYAGGIMVLYVFSILLTRNQPDNVERIKNSKLFAVLVSILAGLAIVLFISMTHGFILAGDDKVTEIDIHSIGNSLISTGKDGYLLPFEIISVFLLACIVGGLLIARKEEDKK
jgi:NADH-quinone oxidoreductase subunit J